jgi:D-methionine transport system ATP-binding protein
MSNASVSLETLLQDSELVLRNVTLGRAQGSSSILDDISFTTKPFSKIGVVGASGAGKTSLLRLINRLAEPDGGQIFWRGKPLSQYSAPLLRQQIMLVPQEPRLLGMTVEQAIAYPLQLQRISSEQIKQRTQLWQKRLPVPDEWQSRQELELSVGQRQWVSIVRAITAQPQILLLDEPTSALDSGRIEQLAHGIKQLECSVFVVSHQLSLIEKTCDHILWLDQGKLRQDCSAQEMDWQSVRTLLAEKNAVPDWEDELA